MADRYYAIGIAASLLLVLAASLFAPVTTASQHQVVIAIDLSHGQGSEGIATIVASCAACKWVLILVDEAQEGNLTPDLLDLFDEVRYGGFTEDNLSDVDVLLIGQASSLLKDEEIQVLQAWASSGMKAVWAAGDSDYPAQGSEIAQQVVNQVMEAVGSSIRIDYVSIEDDASNAGRSYRVVGTVEAEGIFSFLKTGLDNGGKVLFHGPGGLYVLTDDGTPINPVKQADLKPENVYVIVRTTEQSKSVQHQDLSNGGLPAVLYDPLNDEYNTGPFPLMLAELGDGILVYASSETMYGGYEPMTASEYYDVPLDGPQFVANVIGSMVAFVQGTFIVVEKVVTETTTVTAPPVTITETITETQTETVTDTVTSTTTTTETVTQTNTALIAGAVLIVLAAIAAAVILMRR